MRKSILCISKHIVMYVLLCVVCSRLSFSQGVNACDLNGDLAVNVVDVQLAINMAIGIAPCTARIDNNVCNAVVVQRVINAVLGQTCVVSNAVELSWDASISQNVVGYNIYRGTVDGGPYGRINSFPVVGTRYTDTVVQGGQTYYYVATAVDVNGVESILSNQATAAIPSP